MSEQAMSEGTTDELIGVLAEHVVAGSVDEAMACVRACNRLRSQQSHLNNLLSVIHRDGGQHQGKVGTEQAVQDAMEVVVQLREQLETDAVTVRCEGCDEQDELLTSIAELEEQLERIRRVLTGREEAEKQLLPLCPDHRDKQRGKDCLACRIEELEAKLHAANTVHDNDRESFRRTLKEFQKFDGDGDLWAALIRERDGLKAECREYRNALGNPIRNYHQEYNDLLAAKDAEIERLQSTIAKHDICHDLHGKVGRDEFEEGCRRETVKEYGSCGWAERIAELEERVRQADYNPFIGGCE